MEKLGRPADPACPPATDNSATSPKWPKEQPRSTIGGSRLSPDQLNAIRLDPTELRGYAFHDITEIPTRTIPRLARRLTHAHAAHHAGTSHYLEHGNPLK